MEAEVDVKDDNGKTLAAAPRAAAPRSTAVFTHDAEEADDLVKKTIAANLGASQKTSSVATGFVAGSSAALARSTTLAPVRANALPPPATTHPTPRAVSAKAAVAAPL
jgi:membrane fusion protein (multidrug efflux system)